MAAAKPNASAESAFAKKKVRRSGTASSEEATAPLSRSCAKTLAPRKIAPICP